MTIEKGRDWGVPGVVGADVRAVDDDRELAGSDGTVVLRGGNLHAALGRPEPKTAGRDCTLLPVDALRVEVRRTDGSAMVLTAAGEVVVGSWWDRSGLVIVTNTGQLGAMNITPRAHPNDGRLDILRMDGSMSLRDRLTARRRARTGTHLPHPSLRAESAAAAEVPRSGRQALRVDGARIGDWVSVEVTVVPDRFTVAV